MPSPKIIMPAVVLTVICLITTGLLAFTYELTRDERERQAEIVANSNRQALFPEAESFTSHETADSLPEGLLELTKANAADGSLLGWLLLASSRGYGGQVPVLLAFDTAGEITGVRVLANEETPGLGKKIELASFLDQFQGHSASDVFVLKPENEQQVHIDAIAGATISSRAVAVAANIGTGFLHDLLEEEGR